MFILSGKALSNFSSFLYFCDIYKQIFLHLSIPSTFTDTFLLTAAVREYETQRFSLAVCPGPLTIAVLNCFRDDFSLPALSHSSIEYSSGYMPVEVVINTVLFQR